MKKVLAMVLCLVLALSLIACGSQPEEEATSEQKVFGATFMTMDNPFYVDLEEGIRSVVEANGDKLVILDPQFDQSKQISSIEDWIQQGVDGIFVCPVDSAGITPALEEAKAAGIPVIDVDSKCDEADLLLTQVVSDCVLAGRQCGEQLVASMGETGKVAMLTYSVVKPARDRAQGFNEVISQYPGIEVVAQQDVDTCSIEGGLAVMEPMLQAHPEITGVFCINDPIGQGAMAAIESAGKLLPIVSVDGSDECIELIEEGRYSGTAAQFPKEIGSTAANIMYDYLNNGTVPAAEVLIDTGLINAENVADYKK